MVRAKQNMQSQPQPELAGLHQRNKILTSFIPCPLPDHTALDTGGKGAVRTTVPRPSLPSGGDLHPQFAYEAQRPNYSATSTSQCQAHPLRLAYSRGLDDDQDPNLFLF